MEDRFNTIAGWTLFAGIVALGFTSVSRHHFGADKHERPETMGYEIEGVEEEGGGGEAAVPLPNLLAAADVAAGEKLFAKCKACHTVDSGGANGIGPNLYATLGEGIATGKGGFAFSDALKSVGGSWGFDNMDAWLKSPKAFAAGTKMSFAGLGKAEDRANIIVYMNSKGSNLPLPAPVAEAAPADPAAEAPAADGAVTEPGADAAGAVAAPAPVASTAP